MQQKVNAQVEILGASLDAHPLELVSEKIVAANAISTLDAVERIGRRVTVAGVRQTSHRTRTAGGDSMLFLTVKILVERWTQFYFHKCIAQPSPSSIQTHRF